MLSMVACSNKENGSDSTIKDVITIDEDIRTEYSRYIANELNDNSNMGLELLSDMSDKEYTKIVEDDGRTRVYGGYYLTTGFCGTYSEEEKSVITTIFINDSQCDIFGIKKGDSVDVIQDVISKNNYILEDDTEGNGLRYIHYRKGDIRIIFASEEGNIISMAVDLMGYEDISEKMLTVDGDIITEYSIDVAMELNANSKMGLSLLYEIDRSRDIIEYDFGRAREIIKSGYYLTYGYIGFYPDDAGHKEVVITVHIVGSELHVFGIKEGDSRSIVQPIMSEYAYVLADEKQYPDGEIKEVYRKGDVCISFSYIEGKIYFIRVYLERYIDLQEEIIVE